VPAPASPYRTTAEPIPRWKLLLARFVVALMALFVIGGVAWYGVAPETVGRVWQNLVDRPGGPMLFRFFLQPTMAMVAALIAGIRDARLGRPPFWVAVLRHPELRVGCLNEATVATSRIMLLGLIMDGIYQFIEFDAFHPVEAVVITLVLAFLPYLVLRGLVTRIARRSVGGASASNPR
jgi:hypothetical protein